MARNYEMVIGLEVHAELNTETKIFCGCSTKFGGEPNTQCCPVCMGMPGTLPVLNGKVVDYAVKAGLATNCTITTHSKQDRKNYFYPDLPKAYQISQYDLPLCENGYIDISTSKGEKRVGITRIHIEEDAGKLVHHEKYGTMIDCNRCGVPLIEIVSEPDMRSAEEAVAYLEKLRAMIMYTGVANCRMQEGGFRCDVNLSVREKGAEKFGTRTEMKNLNSFAFIAKAIDYEFKRQCEAIESGEEIVQETRRFDPDTGRTYSMRVKEDANDYRYFPDPDLPYIDIPNEKLSELKGEIPVLPDERRKMYMEKYGIDTKTGGLITGDRSVADFFEETASCTKYPKTAANLLTGEIFRLFSGDEREIKISSGGLASIADMAGEGYINMSTAKRLVREVWANGGDPVNIVKEQDLAQINDEGVIRSAVVSALKERPKILEDYKKGKLSAAGALTGAVMAMTKNKANPEIVNRAVKEILEKS